MSFKEYKQRQEAKAYFRSQSSYYLDNETLIKDALIGLGIGAGVGIAYGLITSILPIYFNIFIVVIGYAVSYLLQNIVNHRNIQIAVIAVVATLLAVIVSNFVPLLGLTVSGLSITQMILSSVRIAFSDIITDIYIIASCVLAYKLND